MARTETDVDDTLPVEEAEASGTTTEAANVAPEDAVERRKGREFLDWLARGGLPDLTGQVRPGG
ncbi:type II toxin-antitoxin system VapB family antitoxin [Kitasatospora purpeofusca]|uniref:type II toxin-antitoxin system VapB family antitoxin n=1 Tax=Kitasatospora purpeofusca TaxID=67352 RepID=UPI0030F368AA